MPETEADAEPDAGDSQSVRTISDVDEESESDTDSRPSETAKAKRIARQLRQLGDYNKGPASANVTAIYPSTRIPSVRIVLAIAASHDWNLIQLDLQTAFLQSEMKEEVYVNQPVGFEKLT